MIGSREELGARVRKARRARGMRVLLLAEALDVHWTQVYRLEQGRRYPSLSELGVLSRVLECDPAWLLDGRVCPCTERAA